MYCGIAVGAVGRTEPLSINAAMNDAGSNAGAAVLVAGAFLTASFVTAFFVTRPEVVRLSFLSTTRVSPSRRGSGSSLK